jgi:hypothetical protein
MFRQLDGYDSGARSQLAAIQRSWTGTLDSASWVGSSAPYSQDVTATGMTASIVPIVDVDLSECVDYTAEQAMITAFGLLYRVVSGTNKITAYATAVPTSNIDLFIKGV